jgi:excisionase family DNA binding protein
MNATLPKLLTAGQVADWLMVPRARVLRMARSGELPAVPLPGNDFNFDPSALKLWLKKFREPRPAARSVAHA